MSAEVPQISPPLQLLAWQAIQPELMAVALYSLISSLISQNDTSTPEVAANPACYESVGQALVAAWPLHLQAQAKQPAPAAATSQKNPQVAWKLSIEALDCWKVRLVGETPSRKTKCWSTSNKGWILRLGSPNKFS